MWDNIKKLGGMLVDQTKEQKDILLLNLQIASLADKQKQAFSDLGKAAYPSLKNGDTVGTDTEGVAEILEKIKTLEDELNDIGKQIDAISASSASGRGVMAEEAQTVWEKTKESFNSLKTSSGNEETKSDFDSNATITYSKKHEVEEEDPKDKN